MVGKITKASMKIWTFCFENFQRSPTKFHYSFNLRDLTRVYRGMCCSNSETYKTLNDFVKLWRNEITRTFIDKLCDPEDTKKV